MTEKLNEPNVEKSALSIQKEMAEQLSSMVSGLKEVEHIHARNTKRLDVLDEMQIDKIADNVSKAIDQNNKSTDALEAINKRQDNLEKIASFGLDGKSSENSAYAKYSDQLERYFRYYEPIDEKVYSDMISNVIATEYKGLAKSDEQKIRTFMLGSGNQHGKLLQEGVNPDGGYWVIPERLSDTVTRVFETSPLMQLASVQATATSSVEMIINDNQATIQGAVGELTVPVIEPTPTIGLLTIRVNRIGSGRQLITLELIDDVNFDVTAWLLEKIADKLTRTLNTDMITGDGALKARGILTYPDYTTPGVYERGAVEQIVSGFATDFTYDGFVDLQNAVKEEYQANAVFLMRRKSFSNVLKIKSSDFVPLINANQLAEAPVRIILGNRVLFADDFPDVGAGALAAAYGDFRKGYKVVTRTGLRVLRDPFTQNPFVSFTADMRQGGDVTNYESFKIQRIAV
jgi:HK97 family phage major capsid protein